MDTSISQPGTPWGTEGGDYVYHQRLDLGLQGTFLRIKYLVQFCCFFVCLFCIAELSNILCMLGKQFTTEAHPNHLNT